MTQSYVDTEDMRSVLLSFPKHCIAAEKLGKGIRFKAKIDSVAICGMGGSAISGNLLQNAFPDIKVPVHSIRDYELPPFVGRNTLVFAASYSGNTEETLTAFSEAKKKGCMLAAICSGGKLEEMAKKENVPLIKIPSGIQPRLATPFLFFPMVNVLAENRMLKFDHKNFESLIKIVSRGNFEHLGKKIAKSIKNKIPIMYSSERYFAVAMKWKTDINENAKVHAFYNIYPEFNHNELNAYASGFGQFIVMVIADNKEHGRIKKRIKVTSGLIRSKNIDVKLIKPLGKSMLERVMSTMYLGVWVGYELALLYSIDPTPVKIIEYLKKALGR